MQFGAHVSVAGGLSNAITKGEAIGAEVLQIFVSAPQTFTTTDYSNRDIALFKKMYHNAGFGRLFLHAIYLINLASKNPRLVELSKTSLVHYLEMGSRLGAQGTIVHLGSYKDGNVEHLKTQVIKELKEILDMGPMDSTIIMENCAGKKIGKNLEEIQEIVTAINSDRLKVCIDTQHLYASGINVANREVFGAWLERFDQLIGIENLVCVHANDSKSELGSGYDRHENIGEGLIGLDGFSSILRQPLLADKPFILETPGRNRSGPDKENLNRLKSLV